MAIRREGKAVPPSAVRGPVDAPTPRGNGGVLAQCPLHPTYTGKRKPQSKRRGCCCPAIWERVRPRMIIVTCHEGHSFRAPADAILPVACPLCGSDAATKDWVDGE